MVSANDKVNKGSFFSFDVKSFHRDEDDRHDVFTDRVLEFAATHEIYSVDLPNWDKGISKKSVINFRLDAPSDRCKRKLSLGGADDLTARFYDALVKVGGSIPFSDHLSRFYTLSVSCFHMSYG